MVKNTSLRIPPPQPTSKIFIPMRGVALLRAWGWLFNAACCRIIASRIRGTRNLFIVCSTVMLSHQPEARQLNLATSSASMVLDARLRTDTQQWDLLNMQIQSLQVWGEWTVAELHTTAVHPNATYCNTQSKNRSCVNGLKNIYKTHL